MNVTELNADGLKREYRITVPAAEIEGRIQGRLSEIGRQIRMPGFRPGKVPLKLIRQQHGKRLLGEIVEETVNEGSRQAISDNELKPALRPKVEITSFEEGADLEFTMALEVLPPVPEVDLKAIELERPKAEVGDDKVDEVVQRMAQSRATYAAPAEPRPAGTGDRVVLDFTGKVEGEPFEGGSGTDVPLVLGSGTMIPGFEDQLIGKSAGDETEIAVTFPEAYGEPSLAGKAATFDATVKAVEAPVAVMADDELAKTFGVETLDELRSKIKEQLERDYAGAARMKVKRRLLDRLAADYPFDVPEGMVDLEFDAIWQRLTQDMAQAKQSFEDDGKSEEETKAEYRAIAERRVRLGLILADIGAKNAIKVEQSELQQAMLQQVRRFPGQEKQVFEFFQKNPQAVEELRAPIFEDKVVDFALELARIEDRAVTPEELFAEEPDEAPEPATA